jgi:hypothetical protein
MTNARRDKADISKVEAARFRRIALVVMPLLALLPRLWVAKTLYPADMSVFDTGFGFGDYIHQLAEQGAFRSCSFFPFNPCNTGTCTFATRMPGLPLLLASLVQLVGTHSIAVAVAKCTLLALLSAGFLAALSQDVRITSWGLIVLYGLYLGPQSIKHGAALDYEEGVLLDLSLCLGIAVSYLLRPSQTESARRRAWMGVAAVGLATVMYMTKTTALLTLSIVLALVVSHRDLPPVFKTIGIALVIVPVGFWGWHNVASTGVLSLSSSWNGENLLRGYDSGALAIYPQVSLDRILDSQRAVLDDGTVVQLGAYRSRGCFKNEWEWSKAYSTLAREWLFAHPDEAMHFFAKKVWVTLFEVRHTPVYVSATDRFQEGSPAVRAAMIGWMVAARAVFFLLFWRILRDVAAGRNRTYGWAAALLVAACLPYMVVFSYQRHVVPVLELAGAFLAIFYLAPALRCPSEAASSQPTPYLRDSCSEL